MTDRINLSKNKKKIIAVVVAFLGIIGLSIFVWAELNGMFSDAVSPEKKFIFLNDSFTDRKIIDTSSALAVVEDALGVKNVDYEFSDGIVNNILGNTFYKFGQEYQGIPVYGKSIVVVSDQYGNCLSLSGNYKAVEDVETVTSASADNIKEAITEYVSDSFHLEADNLEMEDITDNALCIYWHDETPLLCYAITTLTADGIVYDFIVDAQSAKVLKAVPQLYEEVGYKASDIEKKEEFEVVHSDGQYIMLDSSRNMCVFNLNGKESQYAIRDFWGRPILDENGEKYIISQWGSGEFLVSDNNIFGDTLEEQEKDYESGAQLLIYVSDIFDQYKYLGFTNNNWLYLYYQDGYKEGNNALGGLIRNDLGILSMGKNMGVHCVDAIVHEFTHFVSGSIVHWAGGNQTAAINEAVSDIMGELIEADIRGTEPDWTMYNVRNIAFPGRGYLSDFSQYNDGIECHQASILISHAAYLMWNGDGRSFFETLDTEELEQLFYSTLYTLPPDCTFSEFRSLMQNMADIMWKQGKLTYKQKLCVSNAFFQVGIEAATLCVKKEASITVYGIDGEEYNNYTLYVINGGAKKEYTAEEIKEDGLTFDKYGEYELLVVDNENTDNQTLVDINVVEQGGVSEIPIFTLCGVGKFDGIIGAETKESDESKEPENEPGTNINNIQLLSHDPYEDHKLFFNVYEYNLTGGIIETDGKCRTYTNLPSNLATGTIPEVFIHNDILESLTIDFEEARGERVAQIMLKFGTLNNYGYGSVKNYSPNIGYEWDGESIFGYFCHEDDSDYFVMESIVPRSSSYGKGYFHMGTGDFSERTETIQVFDLNNSTEIEYQIKYSGGGFTIEEQIRNSKESSSQSRWLYYQDGDRLKFDYGESVYKSYDEAMEHIKKELSKYGLDSRIAGGSGTEPNITPVFIEHRDGLIQDIPLDSIDSLILEDTLYWGINSQYSGAGTSGYNPETFKPESVLGVWDSYDGETRLIFESTGSDFTVTTEGAEFANGRVQIINFVTGEKDFADYIFDVDGIILVHDLEKYRYAFSFENDTMIIHEDYFYKLDNALVNQLIGVWKNDELEIEFRDVDEVIFRDKTGYRSEGRGIYAVINESSIWIIIDYSEMGVLDYSINGNELNLNGTLLYRDGSDASYNTIKELQDRLIGTWLYEGITEDYYVFKEDGYYEYYATKTNYSFGIITQEGPYEVISEDEIRVYEDYSRLAYTVKKFNSEGQLIGGSGNVFKKIK